MTAAKPLCSAEWFARDGKYGFIPRSWMKSQGFGPELFDGRPVIGICNTWSELTPCNRHLRDLAEHEKRGILLAGGFAPEFPVMSLGAPLMPPTTMIFRNLVAMDVEETIRANPIDGVVLLAGCDKTTPALQMGAASCDVPTVLVSGGPMLNGRFRGQVLGSGTDVFRLDDDFRTGRLDRAAMDAAEAAMSRSAGSCMTMGTASTMASIAEAMGIAPSLNGAIPAADSRRLVLAETAGKRIIDLVQRDVRLSQILTRAAFENAVVVTGAIGGSTNAVLHLLALAGRLGVPFTLDDWDRLGRDVPCLDDLKPSGHYLMEDFFDLGGLPVVMQRLSHRLNLDAATVDGPTPGAIIATAQGYDDQLIRTLDNPVTPDGGLIVLRGNLAPHGAVLKPSVAPPDLMQHKGRAVVFRDADEFRARIDDPALDVDADSVLVLQNVGPRGYPGMPEVGSMAIPKKLLAQGVTDMVRRSDARMSGTAYGTVVLHIAPESAIGGPLALVQIGDLIQLDVVGRRLDLQIDTAEFDRRRAAWTAPQPHHDRGYGRLYRDHVRQADLGVDFDFLVAAGGTPPAKVSVWATARPVFHAFTPRQNPPLPNARDRLFSAGLSDALDAVGITDQAMTPAIRPLDDRLKIYRRARTGLYAELRHVEPGVNPDELAMASVDDLRPADVAIFACGGSSRIAPRGSPLSTASVARGAAGCVTDGFVRDTLEIRTLGLRGVSPSSLHLAMAIASAFKAAMRPPPPASPDTPSSSSALPMSIRAAPTVLSDCSTPIALLA